MSVRPFGQGIGISGAPNQQCLTFHVGTTAYFAKGTEEGVSFDNDNPLYGWRVQNIILEPGRRVIPAILRLHQVLVLDIRPPYLCVWLKPNLQAKAWETVIPNIVRILQKEPGLHAAPAYMVARPDLTECNWHVGLLQRLFGSDDTGAPA